jgi:hypothetical protein
MGWRLARDGRRSGELDTERKSLGRKSCGRSPVRRAETENEHSGGGYVHNRSRSEGKNSGGKSSSNEGEDGSRDKRSISYTCSKSLDVPAETSHDMQQISQTREQKRIGRRRRRWRMRSDSDSDSNSNSKTGLGEGDSWERELADGGMTSACSGEDELEVEAGHAERRAVSKEILIEDGEGVRKLLQNAPRQPLTALKLLTSRYGDALEVAGVLSQALAEPGLSPEWRSELEKARRRTFRGVNKKASARPERPSQDGSRVPEFRTMQHGRSAADPWAGLFPTGALTYDVSGDVITVKGPKEKLRAWLRWRGGADGGRGGGANLCTEQGAC